MTVTFQVGDREFGGSGNLEIDFWVRAATSLGLHTSCPCSYIETLSDQEKHA